MDQKQCLLDALRKFKSGDLNIQLDEKCGGIDGEIAVVFNEIVLSRKSLIHDLSEVTTAVANGDFSKKMNMEDSNSCDALQLKTTINTMIVHLNIVVSEVNRVAIEVGTEGKLGVQVQVKGVSGTWKDLIDNVNTMAANITGQVRAIAEVTAAVAFGDLSKKLTIYTKGENLELKNTINMMIDQLGTFAEEVNRVAIEVGIQGKLGGQVRVNGVSGTLKDVIYNVNTMAANVTTQTRIISQVIMAVLKGEFSKKNDAT